MCERRSYKLPLPEALGARLNLEEFPGLYVKIVELKTVSKAGTQALILEVYGQQIALVDGSKVPIKVADYEFNDVSIVIGSANGFAFFSICRSLPDEPGRTNGQLANVFALEVEALWKASFPDATLLPVVGLPSNNKGVLTLTHTDGSGKLLKINGLPSKSFLANNALYSAEISEGIVLNLYEIMIEDIPGVLGGESTAQAYIRMLSERGLQVSGVHFHWFGTDRRVAAIHHQNVGLCPLTFSKLTIEALKGTLALM